MLANDTVCFNFSTTILYIFLNCMSYFAVVDSKGSVHLLFLITHREGGETTKKKPRRPHQSLTGHTHVPRQFSAGIVMLERANVG